MLTQASLPEEEFDKIKKEQVLALEEEQTNPFAAGMNANRQLQYNGHYYQTGPFGTMETVSRINRSDCQECLHSLQRPAHKSSLPLTADIRDWPHAEVLRCCLPHFLPGKHRHNSLSRLNQTVRTSCIYPVRTETGLLLANISAPAIGKQYAIYRCMEAYIGRGLSSPLFIRARDLNGIGYKVGALYDARQYDGLLTLFVQTNQKNKTILGKKLFDMSVLTTFDPEQAKTRTRIHTDHRLKE